MTTSLTGESSCSTYAGPLLSGVGVGSVATPIHTSPADWITTSAWPTQDAQKIFWRFWNTLDSSLRWRERNIKTNHRWTCTGLLLSFAEIYYRSVCSLNHLGCPMVSSSASMNPMTSTKTSYSKNPIRITWTSAPSTSSSSRTNGLAKRPSHGRLSTHHFSLEDSLRHSKTSNRESTKSASTHSSMATQSLVAMQLEGLILRDVLLRGAKAGILALPIHDAVAVEFDHQVWAKHTMEDAWQTLMTEFYSGRSTVTELTRSK